MIEHRSSIDKAPLEDTDSFLLIGDKSFSSREKTWSRVRFENVRS